MAIAMAMAVAMAMGVAMAMDAYEWLWMAVNRVNTSEWLVRRNTY